MLSTVLFLKCIFICLSSVENQLPSAFNTEESGAKNNRLLSWFLNQNESTRFHVQLILNPFFFGVKF